jgi:probable HAF family extracellular repeat protein
MRVLRRCFWLLLCLGFVPAGWAQRQEGMMRDKGMTRELGTYPNGTWFTTASINDLGVIVGRGDVPPVGDDGVGYTHTLAVYSAGPHAGEWFDLGALDGDQSKGFEYESFTQISNTGLVAGHSTGQDGYVHGVAWTRETGMVELGTLADTGDPAYADYKSSSALGTNKLGTLIVGDSGPADGYPVPVAWTPTRIPGRSAVVWRIQKLATPAALPYGHAWWVNDLGQISGVCFSSGYAADIGVVWNPRADGRGWRLTPLPLDPAYPNSNAYGINDSGEITGVAVSADGSTWLPRLWKPLNWRRTEYSIPIELPLPEGFTGCESVGLNDLGDIVGDCWNDQGMDLPARWSTDNLHFSKIIKFPGDGGYSWGVNNRRIAAVTYWGGENCPSDSCAGAVELK